MICKFLSPTPFSILSPVASLRFIISLSVGEYFLGCGELVALLPVRNCDLPNFTKPAFRSWARRIQSTLNELSPNTVLLSHLLLGLWSDFFPEGFPNVIIYAFLLFLTSSTGYHRLLCLCFYHLSTWQTEQITEHPLITQLSILTHAQLQSHRLKFIKNYAACCHITTLSIKTSNCGQ